ncbi:FAD/NAD(P)-binding protein [Fluoribacter gormanii]|uniref:FAD binding domain n=1 Tax=Fluoribacter gormanii TaxID=464 RepID=A0A377GJU9_9GAMM|nr:FAD/NAD(P)-binding protein [Fluoribacter gormanii]KTD00896.1 FAD binding domain protein [Fluoribacter gormanii]SIR49234.1 hypothetical protein SAMN05421777_11387 [Fluoribacter gormanii]STO24805.1 FAD binding domain [Fluoribacter gormanii]
MANHVIVGAGLGGLYEANRLINKGVKPENIVIIEKRPENHYTRPGHLNPKTFDLVTSNTGIQTPHSQAHHIKELERLMYAHLHRLNVRFIDEEFIGLQAQAEDQPKAVITRKIDASRGVYPADYVFDCSGRNASVAQAVNAHQQLINSGIAFETRLLVDINPIPYHLVGHVIIPNNSSLIVFVSREGEAVPPHVQRSSLQRNIELRERLRALGWTYEAFPTFYTHSQGAKDKVCIYMETPPNLSQAQQREWIQLLLDIYSDGMINDYTELKPSIKYGVKPRIISFQSIPYVLNKVVHESNSLPTVILGFDAVKGFDYRLAHGVNSGIECCERMLRHITVTDGSIKSIDSAAIERETFAYINDLHKNRLANRLSVRQKAIENAFDYFSEVYESAAAIIPAKKQEYQSIAGQLAYRAATNQFSKLETREQTAVSSLEVLNKCLSVLIRAHSIIPHSDTNEYHDVNSKLVSIINIIRLEVSAFNIEQVLAQPNNDRRLRALFESIAENFQRLDGHFARNFVLSKIKEILEQISQLPVQNTRPQTYVPIPIDDSLLLFLLFNSVSNIEVSTPLSAGNLSFFNTNDRFRIGDSTSLLDESESLSPRKV